MRSFQIFMILFLLVIIQTYTPAQQYEKEGKVNYQKNIDNPEKFFPSKSSNCSNYFSIKPNSIAYNSISLTEPMLFPHLGYTGWCEAIPVSLNNGNILIIWKQSVNVLSALSSDGAMTWETPVSIASGNASLYISGICTNTGRVICIWQEGSGLVISFSDDNGLSWTPYSFITNNPEDRFTTITQTRDGNLWLTYSRPNPGVTENDIYYRTSTNDGINWGEESLFTAAPSNEICCSVVSGVASSLIAIYCDDADGWDIYVTTSNDDGATWSEPNSIVNSEQPERTPRVLRQGNGDLWIIYEMSNPTPILPSSQWDIYYTQSSDGGNSWTPSQRFTNFIGDDRLLGVDIYNNQPFVSFSSWRSSVSAGMWQIWYGLIGTTEDTDLPPAVFGSVQTNSFADSLIDIIVGVDDESGITNVQLSYTLNGINYGPVQMYDDGLHNDRDPGDNVWGNAIGPFPPGMVQSSFTVSDIDSHEITVESSGFEIRPIHNKGNILMNFQSNSRFADPDLTGTNVYWPANNGDDYLFVGGFWAGTNCLGDIRVDNAHYDEDVDWAWKEESIMSLEPGLSDQDGDLTFSDQYTQSPHIGLTVNQKSYQWSSSSRDDFIIFKYTIKNTGSNGNLTNIFTSIWLDPDIGDYEDNLGGYDATKGLIYLYNNQGIPGGYLGLKLLGAGNNPYTATIERPGSNDEDRYNWMTAGIIQLPTDPDDYNLLLTAQPFDLQSGDSTIVAFGLVLGGSLEEMQANADTMENIYNNIIVSVEDFSSNILPTNFSLFQNYPNPFNPSTKIKYSVPTTTIVEAEATPIKLKIYDVLGNEIEILVDETKTPGFYEVEFDASNLSSGVYFCRLQAGLFVETKKMLLLK